MNFAVTAVTKDGRHATTVISAPLSAGPVISNVAHVEALGVFASNARRHIRSPCVVDVPALPVGRSVGRTGDRCVAVGARWRPVDPTAEGHRARTGDTASPTPLIMNVFCDTVADPTDRRQGPPPPTADMRNKNARRSLSRALSTSKRPTGCRRMAHHLWGKQPKDLVAHVQRCIRRRHVCCMLAAAAASCSRPQKRGQKRRDGGVDVVPDSVS
jgi:hypothetical protein